MINKDRDLPIVKMITERSRRALRLAVVMASVAALAIPPAAFGADARDGYVPSGSSGSKDGFVASDSTGGVIEIGIGKSRVVNLPRDAQEVFVADGGIAKAVVRSLRKAYLVGVSQGQTDVKFIGADGVEIASYDVAVSRDVGAIHSSIARSIDGGKVRVEGVGDGIVVTGSVKSAQEAQTAVDIAAGYMTDRNKVVNALKIEGQDQVMLRVKVVEMKREIIKQLGIDYAASNLSIAGVVTNGLITEGGLASSFPFGVNKNNPNGAIGFTNKANTFGASLQAMERTGLVKTLAEPNLTAISGESAKFLAGGQYPFPGACSYENGICTRAVEFKDFGVGLNFTPVVLTGGRISLKIATEVSEIDPANGINDRNLVIPGLQVRRANSTVEVPSGGSVALAGLIQQQSKRAMAGWPGLMKMPVLGALFRSNDYLKNETELAIFVTPYLTKPVPLAKLSSPDDGFAEPSDPSAILLGRLNRLYGVPGKTDPKTVGRRPGAGFIVD